MNYMRDVTDADVYILVTQQSTGSGGSEFVLKFEGQKEFEGQKADLTYTTDPTMTSVERRDLMVKRLKAGLMPYVANSGVFEQISVNFDAPSPDENSDAGEEKTKEKEKDPWNSWVYNIGANGWFNGQSSYRSISTNGRITATRVTDTWKLHFRLWGNLNRDKFIFEGIDDDEDGEDDFLVFQNHSFGFRQYLIRALNDHWSVGGRVNLNSSNFSNIKFGALAGPAIEYNFYPYEETNIRELRFSYSPAAAYNIYADTTIYGKTEELLFRNNFEISYAIQSKWGSVDASLDGSHYFHDPKLYRIGLYGGVNVRIVKGLNFRVSGNVSLIRDQISLIGAGITTEDFLLQQREVATNFTFWGSFGINYTFGSVYNNVVFPRFGGGL